jgi:hypothetical protein
MRSHYYDADKGEFIFSNLPISEYKWVPIKYCNDYVTIYNTNNPMNSNEEQILTFFTQQEIRSVEQAYSTYTQPTNYKGIQVSTWHNNWYADNNNSYSGSKRLSWTTEDGTEHTRSSIDAGAKKLGFSNKYIRSLAKIEGATLNTTKYGKVSISIEGTNKDLVSIDKRYGTPVNTFVDTTDLLPNHYYLYDKDMNQLEYGPYPTARAANVGMELEPNYSGTHLWTNYIHLIQAIGLGMSVYMVKRLVGQAMPVMVESLVDGKVTEYRSMNAALKVIVPGKPNDSHLLGLIVNGKPYTNKEGLSYLIRYKNGEHHVAAVQRYNALGLTRSKPKK